MKILSNFKDYYDAAINGMSQSDAPVFRRVYSRVYLEGFHRNYWVYPSSLLAGAVYLCGAVYPFLASDFFGASSFLYSMEDAEAWAAAHLSEGRYKRWSEEAPHRDPRVLPRREFAQLLGLEVRGHTNQAGIYEKLFSEKVSSEEPVAAVCGRWFYKPARLLEFGFQKVLPPLEVYRQIEEFMSNLIEPANPTVLVKDKDLVTAKGFDKWSFRKMPEEKG